ncbi:copper chaperone PCu(A)C [Rhizobiaceae bacterium BDR2-2]|uniref:Copper chaperone PCu(A)C n=1 Tax=Ectorhizobium quercum TaxID=2965071 RepID=A0AAE3MX28_9HYPH|nr:copper chaperone PCu(A)C [Ectorhizobium quercum]MCX8996843.1 copper chaperone PCu(A)C [Ectorhizobium quercum]
MNLTLKRGLAAALVTFAGFSAALAHGFTVGDLEIGHPWSRPTVAGATVGGGYLTITNEGTADDRLVSVSTDRAGAAQLHDMKVEDDVMKMREIEDGIAVPAGQTVELKPGGLHVMFLNLSQPFAEGEKIKATLTFEKAGTVEVEFVVQQPRGEEHGDAHAGHGAQDDHSAPKAP